MKFFALLTTFLRRPGAAPALLALLVACGGEVGSGGTGGFAAGPITGFGSVIVNDVRFDDTAATVEDGDGTARSRDDLRLGMTVEIDSGAVTTTTAGATASANRIRYASDLRGPVLSVDVVGGSFMVLGQRVTVDTTTVFGGLAGGLAALNTGTTVEVYALYDAAAQRYRAKRVAAASASDGARLRGPVAQLDLAGQTLKIGSITFSYAGAMGVPADLAVGRFVRLRLSSSQPSGSGRYTVAAFGTAQLAVPDVEGADVKGLISSFTSSSVFSVDGRAVDASAASFPDGRSGLGLGVRVEVEGKFLGGTLRASKVSIESDRQDEDHEFEIHGAIEAVSTAQQTITVRGQTISTARPGLRYENGTAANLVVGRRVEVKGLLSADQQRIEATLINFE